MLNNGLIGKYMPPLASWKRNQWINSSKKELQQVRRKNSIIKDRIRVCLVAILDRKSVV